MIFQYELLSGSLTIVIVFLPISFNMCFGCSLRWLFSVPTTYVLVKKLETMFMKYYAPNTLLVKKDGNLL